MTKKTGREIANVLIPILYGLLAIAVAMLVCWSGQYPFGSDTMTYIYRGDTVYNSIMEGNWFPLYDPMWYNGVELLGYCEPVPMYFMALCQALAGGDPIDGYLMFVGLIFLIGAIVWFFVGKRKNRVALGAFLGILWFVVPHNLYVLFMEGNLARGLSAVLLPIFISYGYDYILESGWSNLLKMMIAYVIITLCDFEYSIMVIIGLLLFMVVYGVIYHKWRKLLNVLIAVVGAYLTTGFWSIPHMIANIGSDNTEVMNRYFQSIFKTLNPLERYESINQYYYFGLAAFLLAVFGILCSKKKSLPGLWTGILLLFSTAMSMYPILEIIPGSSYLLMCQYISIAVCFILYGFLNWKTLRKPIQIVLCVLLILDVIPSLNLVYGTLSGVPVAERFDEQYDTTLIKKAKEVSQQRIAFLDGGELEAMGTYLVSKYEGSKAGSYGSDWQTAQIQSNLMQLNRALTNGFYPYLFDRCKELGNDTVLIKMSQVNVLEAPVEMLDAAAVKAGYELVASNEFYRLYDMDIEGNWGTVTTYSAIGIGTNASVISLSFPAVKEGSSANINDYTYEELSRYEMIYLSDFTYNDRTSAEELILKLSESGVRIVVLADGIPEDKVTYSKEFLGITCNDITFSNGYPLLDTNVGVLDLDFFPQGYEEWNTVYVNGLDEVWGTVREDELDLCFCGTVKNDNIVVLGLNLTYYYSMTKDENAGKLLSNVTAFSSERLPYRRIVPITVSYEDNYLIITSTKDNVNTSLAYLDVFTKSDGAWKENNLVYVNEGVAYISIGYPHMYVGLVVSIIGIGLSVFFLLVLKKNETRED